MNKEDAGFKIRSVPSIIVNGGCRVTLRSLGSNQDLALLVRQLNSLD
jgi:hypothetical protein